MVASPSKNTVNGSKIDLVVTNEMPSQFGLIVDGSEVWWQSRVVQVMHDNPKLGLVSGQQIILFFPNKNRKENDQYNSSYEIGSLFPSESKRTYVGVKIEPLIGARISQFQSKITPHLKDMLIFKMIGKAPENEEFKTQKKANTDTNYLLSSTKTRQEFDKIESKLKAALITIPTSVNPYLSSVKDVPYTRLNKQDQAFARKMKKWFDENILELDPQEYEIKGKPRIRYTITRDIHGQLLGGEISVFVKGIDPNEDPSTADSADISWNANVVLDYDLNHIDGETDFEWTGH
jgi:hypothetical protein